MENHESHQEGQALPESKPKQCHSLRGQQDTSMAKRVMSMTGYAMLLASIGLLVFLAYQYFKWPFVEAKPESEKEILIWVLQNFTDDIIIFLSAIFLSITGVRLLGAAGKGVPTTILDEDRELLEPLIKQANKEAINQYVILSSLSGFTGNFQKIGFSGLPLATVTLTLIFSALSFLDQEFLELAKLTLGAFIGSFVQKGAEGTRLSIQRTSTE